jgi:hypothetical protein
MALKEVKTILIDGVALLETRPIERAASEKSIFLHIAYVTSLFSEHHGEISSYIRIEKPKSVSSDNYFSITELKPIVADEGYNKIVIDLLLKCKTFDEVNIVFQYVLKGENFSKEQANQIVVHALENKIFQQSFEPQLHMIDFISKNKKMIEWPLYQRIMAEFPHSNFGGRLV